MTKNFFMQTIVKITYSEKKEKLYLLPWEKQFLIDLKNEKIEEGIDIDILYRILNEKYKKQWQREKMLLRKINFIPNNYIESKFFNQFCLFISILRKNDEDSNALYYTTKRKRHKTIEKQNSKNYNSSLYDDLLSNENRIDYTLFLDKIGQHFLKQNFAGDRCYNIRRKISKYRSFILVLFKNNKKITEHFSQIVFLKAFREDFMEFEKLEMDKMIYLDTSIYYLDILLLLISFYKPEILVDLETLFSTIILEKDDIYIKAIEENIERKFIDYKLQDKKLEKVDFNFNEYYLNVLKKDYFIKKYKEILDKKLEYENKTQEFLAETLMMKILLREHSSNFNDELKIFMKDKKNIPKDKIEAEITLEKFSPNETYSDTQTDLLQDKFEYINVKELDDRIVEEHSYKNTKAIRLLQFKEDVKEYNNILKIYSFLLKKNLDAINKNYYNDFLKMRERFSELIENSSKEKFSLDTNIMIILFIIKFIINKKLV